MYISKYAGPRYNKMNKANRIGNRLNYLNKKLICNDCMTVFSFNDDEEYGMVDNRSLLVDKSTSELHVKRELVYGYGLDVVNPISYLCKRQIGLIRKQVREHAINRQDRF